MVKETGCENETLTRATLMTEQQISHTRESGMLILHSPPPHHPFLEVTNHFSETVQGCPKLAKASFSPHPEGRPSLLPPLTRQRGPGPASP